MSDSRDYKSILLVKVSQAVIQMIVITVNLHRILLSLLNLLSLLSPLNKLSLFYI